MSNQSENHKLVEGSNTDADLYITYVEGEKKVIKTVPKSQRSVKNIKKQEEFIATGRIRSVSMNFRYTNDDKILIEMPYAVGYVGSDYAKYCDLEDKIFLVGQLKKYFDSRAKKSTVELVPKEKIKSKLRELEISVRNARLKNLTLRNTGLECLSLLSALFESKEYYYPRSECHGDFTLSNIIYDKTVKKIYLIDFLDIYLNTYLCDYAKLLQDIHYGWSARYLNRALIVKHQVLGAKIKQEIELGFAKWTETIDFISILNTIRIIPYCQDTITEEWLISVLEQQKKGIR